MDTDVMCSSGVAIVLAISLQTIGVLALLIGFFSGLGNLKSRDGWGAGVFVAGVAALAIGTRIMALC